MKYKRYPLLEHQFDSLPFEEWKIKELPFSLHNHIPNTFRAKDAVGILYSGDMGSPKFIEGFENIVAGFDILAHETKPKIDKDEPELNSYHMLIQKLDPTKNKYPYLLIAPLTGELLFGHWRRFDVFEEYIKTLSS